MPLQKIYLSLLLIFVGSLTHAQDPGFSQFYANRVYLNPAYAGFDPGGTLIVNYRDQWFGLPDGDPTALTSSYRTINATFDLQLPCFFQSDHNSFGVAFSALSDWAGSAPLVTNAASLALSYEQNIFGNPARGGSSDSRLDLRVGFEAGMFQRQIKSDYFLYTESLHPLDGIVNGPEQYSFNTNLLPNMNAGVMVRGFAKIDNWRDIVYTMGLAFSNVNEPNISFTGADLDSLAMRTTIHGGFAFSTSSRTTTLRPPFIIGPQFRYDMQGGLRQLVLGSYFFSKAYYTGFFYQTVLNRLESAPTSSNFFIGKNTNALIISAGVDLRTLADKDRWDRRDSGLVLGFSYDFSLGGLGNRNTLGTFELNLRYNLISANRGRKRCDAAGGGKFELFGNNTVKCPVSF
ncbi:MAG TPA: PorP/SprF family type IX secretion system membrane protein [Saprospiraceae bacterium]|nr:PorP/SprF family type IX secretion system membrane protein [Saprospiraceae bacterium]